MHMWSRTYDAIQPSEARAKGGTRATVAHRETRTLPLTINGKLALLHALFAHTRSRIFQQEISSTLYISVLGVTHHLVATATDSVQRQYD